MVEQTTEVAKTDDRMIEYETERGVITLTPDIIRNRFCEKATDGEILEFVKVCQYTKLNPYLQEIFMVKYGQNAAQIIIHYTQYLLRAQSNPNYDQYESGLYVIRKGETIRLPNCFYEEGDAIAGAWCNVFMRGSDRPIPAALPFNELGQFKDGKPTARWKTHPASMAEKVIISITHRRACPHETAGLYTEEEMGIQADGDGVVIEQADV